MEPIEDLDPEAEQIVLNLLEYFAAEEKNGGPLCPLEHVEARVAEALKIPVADVMEVVAEMKNGSLGRNTSHKLRRKRGKKKKRSLNVRTPREQ